MQTMTNNQTTTVDTAAIAAALEAAAAEARRVAAEATARAVAFETALRLARGTQELSPATVEAAQALPVIPAAQLAHSPYWLGDTTDTQTLIAMVARCISDKPRTRQELIDLIGARGNRINGALVKLQVKHPRSIKNMGVANKASWYMPPKGQVYNRRTER